MTTPGGQYPDDTLGDDLSPLQGITQESWEMGVRNKAIAPYNNGHNNLADLLGSILQNLARAAMQGLGAIAEGFANLFGAVVEGIGNFLNGLTAAILGQNPSGQVPPSVGSSFADIRDGQRALIDKLELLDDNAGFINLCMSKNWNVRGSKYDFKWLLCDFDTQVTVEKNAHAAKVYATSPTVSDLIVSGQFAEGHGIVFDAPGVWNLNVQLTNRALNANGSPDSAPRYFETDVRVYRSIPAEDDIYLHPFPNPPSDASLYSSTRTTWTTGGGVLQSAVVNKPIVIPPEEGDHVYTAIVLVRFAGPVSWTTWGGTLYSSFSAQRQSVDTTDYNAPDQGTSTEVIS